MCLMVTKVTFEATTCVKIMSALNIFCIPVKYTYKSRILSFCTLIVVLFKIILIVGPLIIAFEAGGLWLRAKTYVEVPSVKFTHKYLLIAERNFDTTPIVCSTFAVYRKNPIKDDCSIVKIREADIDKDRLSDIFKFEFLFYSDSAVQNLQILLFFEVQLKDVIHKKIDSLAFFDYVLPHETQKIHVIGDLRLNQKGVIRIDEFSAINNETVDLSDHSLAEVLAHNARKKFSTSITNTQVTWQTGFSSDEPITISGEIFYLQQLLYYQPRVWEELKWAWIQYLSLLIAFSYCIKKLLIFLFNKSLLKSYVIVPWKTE